MRYNHPVRTTGLWLILILCGCRAMLQSPPAEPETLLAGAASLPITPLDEKGDLWQEPYQDLNHNGRYDAPNPLAPTAYSDPYADENHNGKWDGPFLAGFAHKGSYYVATGVHDPLWARALVLQYGRDRVALVALDVVGLFYPDVNSIRNAVADLGFDYIMIASTHTHGGPDTLGLWGPNPLTDGKDPRFMNHLKTQAAAAIRLAYSRRQPARLIAAHATPPTEFGRLVSDRRDPVVIEDRIRVLQAVDPHGNAIATVVNWSPHPETMGGAGSLITSDFPHHLRETIEEGGAMVGGRVVPPQGGEAIYLSGAVGGLMTTLGAEVKDETGRVLPQRSFEKMQRIGELAAAAAVQAIENQRPLSISGLTIRSRSLSIEMDNKLFLELSRRGILQRAEPPKRFPPDLGDPNRTEVAVLTLQGPNGPMVQFLFVPGELFPEIEIGGYLSDTGDCWAVTDRKKALDGVGRERLLAAHPGVPTEPVLEKAVRAPIYFLVGLANDELGYIVPANDFVFPTYHPMPRYGRDRCGDSDHYEETMSAGSKLAPVLTRALVELLEEP